MDYIIIIIALIVLAQTSYLSYRLVLKESRVARQSIYVDTSVLIDGRILAIAHAGFIPGELVIPRSVLRELQTLADGSDNDKRLKARKGMDLARELQGIETISVRIQQDGAALEGVDERLIELAKKHHASICTIDFNLNKVAQVEGIAVLNINELAKNIRSVHMPGERLVIDLVTHGQDSHQGVGYLDDGTMVVVENASKFVGTKKEVEFIRLLQTDAGKMMFARLAGSRSGVGAGGAKKLDKQPVRRLISRKTTGRKAPAAPAESTVAAVTEHNSAPAAPPTPVATKQPRVSKKPSRERNNSRKTNEDSLMDLINKQ
ncbi:MAG: PilT protein domain protein [Candidatus Saccharibacteria bacterium GW2011_GWC2_48_9]|nr:MAG: PilT protein domain protein [Candidatus Saccharibacteria bacterium GW2011_GWC2_48_9]HCH34864.1 hypothetical protein [Candidatus Saccharibacteria bacterium]